MNKQLLLRASVITALAVAACAAAMPASAQSLGDVARKEAARRKAVKGPVTVVTNDNLKVVPAPAPPATAAGAQPATPEAGGEPVAAAGNQAQPPEPAKGAEYWKKRITDAREKHDQNVFLLEAVQSRINALTTDFYARDDPFQRAKVGEERQKALDQLERITQEQAALKKEIADIEEEARRANVPPGWLR